MVISIYNVSFLYSLISQYSYLGNVAKELFASSQGDGKYSECFNQCKRVRWFNPEHIFLEEWLVNFNQLAVSNITYAVHPLFLLSLSFGHIWCALDHALGPSHLLSPYLPHPRLTSLTIMSVPTISFPLSPLHWLSFPLFLFSPLMPCACTINQKQQHI